MARGKEIWAKVEPSFVLGRSPAGQVFASMSLEHQAIYLRLWCLCVETRIVRWRCVGAASAQLRRSLGVSSRTLASFLAAAPAQLLRIGDSVEVLGVTEHHKGLRWRATPQTGNERGQDGAQTGTERVVEEEEELKPPLPPRDHPAPEPASEPTAAGGQAALGSGEATSQDWAQVLRSLPALERKAVARHAVRAMADQAGQRFEVMLATVVEVCEDEEAGRVRITHSPLALASARLRDGRGLRNGTLGRVRKALGMPVAETEAPRPARRESLIAWGKCGKCGTSAARPVLAAGKATGKCARCGEVFAMDTES